MEKKPVSKKRECKFSRAEREEGPTESSGRRAVWIERWLDMDDLTGLPCRSKSLCNIFWENLCVARTSACKMKYRCASSSPCGAEHHILGISLATDSAKAPIGPFQAAIPLP